jgi:hypothetical protein
MPFYSGQWGLMSLDGVSYESTLKSASMQRSRDLYDSTTIDNGSGVGNPWRSFVAGLMTGSFEFEGLFEVGNGGGAAENYTTFFEQAADVVLMFAVNPGVSISGPMYACNAKVEATPISSPVDGLVTQNATAKSNGPVDRCTYIFPAEAALTASGDGTSVDLGAAGAGNGGRLYMMIPTASGTSTTFDVIVEHSTTGAWAGEETTLATFAQVTDADRWTAQQISFSGTCNRYVRGSYTIAGTSPQFNANIALYVAP